MNGFIFAWRVDTGQRVRIPASHLRVFPGFFTTTDPATKQPRTRGVSAAPAAPDEPVPPADDDAPKE